MFAGSCWVLRDRLLLARLRSLVIFKILTLDPLRLDSSCPPSAVFSGADRFSVLEDLRDGIGIIRRLFLVGSPFSVASGALGGDATDVEAS